MKRLICVTLGSLLIQATVSAAPDKNKDKGRKPAERQTARSADTPERRVTVQVAFGAADVRIIRDHYTPQYRNLPPGLRKKVARGKPLPPGWQKKYQPFPVALERRLEPLAPEYRRGVFDGHAVIYNSRTNTVIDVAVLF